MASTSAAVKTSFSVCKASISPRRAFFCSTTGVLYSPAPAKPSDGLVGLPAVPLALPHGRSASSARQSLIAVLGGFIDHLKVPISEAVEVAFQVRVKSLEVILCDDLFS